MSSSKHRGGKRYKSKRIVIGKPVKGTLAQIVLRLWGTP